MVRVEAVKVFTDNPRKGNLAGVVLDAGNLSDLTMQSIAHTVQASEASFVLPSAYADIRVRWFTPNNEVGICVHATIAAVGSWAQSTGDRRCCIDLQRRSVARAWAPILEPARRPAAISPGVRTRDRSPAHERSLRGMG